MRILLTVTLHLILSIAVFGQSKADFYVGEWKSYQTDNSTFDYLKLNKDGTGIKAIGKTINGQDTILKDHHSFMQITKWKVKKKELTFELKHGLMYEPNGTYIIEKTNDKTLNLLGDHFELGIYPSPLNKETFRRSLTFTNSKFIDKENYGVKTDTCLFEIQIITFEELDSTFQTAIYKGFDDLIPHLMGCTQEYKFVKNYHDPPYQINLPMDFNSWSYGYGDDNFYISLENREDSLTETSIVIYYDFTDRSKNHYFSQIESGKEEKNLISFNGKDLYLFTNWQKKYSGKIFYDNHIYIGYYTQDKSKEETLRECIASFKYKN